MTPNIIRTPIHCNKVTFSPNIIIPASIATGSSIEQSIDAFPAPIHGIPIEKNKGGITLPSIPNGIPNFKMPSRLKLLIK